MSKATKTKKAAASRNSKELVIVESPAKARTIGKFLGSKYHVVASMGHIRDLPKSKLGVEVEKDFEPSYIVPQEKKSVVKEIREAAEGASAVNLATDPDREGEAIAWHLMEAAGLDKKRTRRVFFHEITRDAIEKAFKHPREIDMNLVNAQQTRRILDRLVGYKISPILWQKVKKGLSAGRVQSAALRLVVEREREIEGFVPVEYWTIEAELAKLQVSSPSLRARLVGLGVKGTKIELKNKEQSDRVLAGLRQSQYAVIKVVNKESPRHPAPPFITSTLQQEAWRKLHFAAKHTMAIAQQLYEGLAVGAEGTVGLITYMRTDSTQVAAKALDEVREYISRKYGKDYLPANPRHFAKKVKGAQEAHEAIRPTSFEREPERMKQYLTRDQLRLYELIWKRMVASQMAHAVFSVTTVDISAKSGAGDYLLRATNTVVKFPGFITVYTEGRDDSDDSEASAQAWPPLAEGEGLKLLDLFSEQNFTQPPPRYTEASLVKMLEEKGIGRPSTYAPILSTIQDRQYVEKKEGKFWALDLGKVVSDQLSKHFPEIVDLEFTASMENKLDDIASGDSEWVPALDSFYKRFEKDLKKASTEMERVKIAPEEAGEDCPNCGKPMVIRSGRFGRFIACSGYPECKTTKRIVVKSGAKCPECGADILVRRSKNKKVFYGCSGFPACKFLTNRKPLAESCPKCGGLLVLAGRGRARCTKCNASIPLDDLPNKAGVAAAAEKE